jgi:hypothetical protein
MCGPQTEIVQRLEPLYRRRVNFIHIEIYKDANPAHGYARTVRQWHLQTEPWVFVVDRRGRIAAKFEDRRLHRRLSAAVAGNTSRQFSEITPWRCYSAIGQNTLVPSVTAARSPGT